MGEGGRGIERMQHMLYVAHSPRATSLRSLGEWSHFFLGKGPP